MLMPCLHEEIANSFECPSVAKDYLLFMVAHGYPPHYTDLKENMDANSTTRYYNSYCDYDTTTNTTTVVDMKKEIVLELSLQWMGPWWGIVHLEHNLHKLLEWGLVMRH